MGASCKGITKQSDNSRDTKKGADTLSYHKQPAGPYTYSHDFTLPHELKLTHEPKLLVICRWHACSHLFKGRIFRCAGSRKPFDLSNPGCVSENNGPVC